MGAVDNVVLKQGHHPGVWTGHASLTATGASTLVAPFKVIATCLITVRSTNTTTYAVSAETVTITGTNDDVVDFYITGY